MARLSSYFMNGLYVEDFSVEVPLDWQGAHPAEVAAGTAPEEVLAGERTSVFYRTICAADRAHDELPLLIYLQGGPGGEGARPGSATSPGWFTEALRHYRVVMPDQRGCGRSSRIDGNTMMRFGADGRAGADFLKCFLADSIVRDFEYLRLTEFGGKLWTTLGVSYGGFLTLTYLSFYPEGVAASFVYSGIPAVPASVGVYEHTFPRMRERTLEYYRRFPEDEERIALLADILSERDVRLPDGSPFTVRRLQQLGSSFGMSSGMDSLHWLLDMAFKPGDGSLAALRSGLDAACTPASKAPAGVLATSAHIAPGAGSGADDLLSQHFLMSVLSRTTQAHNPLYWPLQEFIFCEGECEPCRWAAQREYDRHPDFSPEARPLMLTGEAMFPWMFETDPVLVPFKPAMDVLMEETRFGRLYDAEQLARNEVPLYACVNFDDLYVPADVSFDTLSRIGASRAWVQNEFAHDGVVVPRVFERLFGMAHDAGDLDGRL